MENSEHIRAALRAYLADQGLTAEGLGPRLGVSSSTSIRWANGKSKTIRPSHWAKLKPLLADYLADPALKPNVPALSEAAERVRVLREQGEEVFMHFSGHGDIGPCPHCAVLAAATASLAARVEHLTPEERKALARVAEIVQRSDPNRLREAVRTGLQELRDEISRSGPTQTGGSSDPDQPGKTA